MAADDGSMRVHWGVKAFVLFHMAVVFSWSMPALTLDKEEAYLSKPLGERLATPVDGWLVVNRRLRADPWPLFKELPAEGLKVRSPTSYYLLSTGLWQGWDMFAPNPADTDVWVDSVVTFEDGSEKIIDLRRIYTLSIPEKYIQERFRKFRERFSDDANGWKWPHAAYRFALEAKRATGKEPVRVALRRHWQEIRPPGQETPSEYETYTFYETLIDAQTFEEMEAL